MGNGNGCIRTIFPLCSIQIASRQKNWCVFQKKSKRKERVKTKAAQTSRSGSATDNLYTTYGHWNHCLSLSLVLFQAVKRFMRKAWKTSTHPQTRERGGYELYIIICI